MSCNEHQLQMSLCLDGRLPAGSRAVVLAHIASCGDCDRVWTDLQKAQDLVLNLPVQKTSRDFRQTLWARIEAGEGAPEVKLTEPVGAWTKARYVLAGAAAAALLIISSKLLLTPLVAPTEKTRPEVIAKVDSPEPAAGASAAGASDTALHPKAPFAGNSTVISFDEDAPRQLAGMFAQRTVRSVRTLRNRLCANNVPVPNSFVEPEIQAAVAELRTAIDVMRWLREDGLLAELPRDVETDLQLITRVAAGTADSKMIQAVICEGAELERLPSHLFVRQTVDPRIFLQQFKLRLDRDPRLKGTFSLQIPTPNAGGQIFVVVQDAGSEFEKRR